jgi:hypothetical protein
MLTKERACELFEYMDGVLYNRVQRGPRKAGAPVGSKNDTGRLLTVVDGKKYYNYQLVFLMHHGHIPKMIDHKDTDCTNNKIGNLREADKPQNGANQLMRPDNKSGFKGVSKNNDRPGWRAQIRVNKKKICLGDFVDMQDAVEAAKAARLKYHGEFANHGETP